MWKKVFIIFAIILGTQTCRQQEDSYSVYNDVLLDVIGTSRYHIPFNSIFQYDSIKQRELWNDYVYAKNRPIEKRRLFLEVFSSLEIHQSDIPNLTRLYGEIPSCDSVLVSKLVASSSKKEILDFKKMQPIGRYELYSSNQELDLRTYIKENNDKYVDVGFIAISKVVFTDNNDNGCFLYEMIDPGGHGYRPRLIFVEKGLSKWTVSKELGI
nr:hypothetical protein [uncultured Carboxylicivirga sp.]